MLRYSEEFEKRRKKINEIIKENKNKEEKIILQTIYSVSNIEDKHNDKDKLEKVKGTFFSDQKMKDLLNQFVKENFNNKGNKYYEELFQEVYNRQTKENGYEPRYLVEVSGESANTNGYMIHGVNMLNINAGMIEKYKKVDEFSNNTDKKNASTIGAHSLLTLIHETQHTFQSEGMMKFVLGEDVDDQHERARNAICIARRSLATYVNYMNLDELDDEMDELYSLMKDNYWVDYMEHDSNMAPVKFINKQVKEGNLPNEVFLKAGRQRVINDIHIKECTTSEEVDKALKERAEEMENVVRGYYRFFNKIFKDGEIKNSVSQVLGEYLKVDENGKSQFNKDLNKDFNMCLDYMKYVESVTAKKGNKTENQAKNNKTIDSEESFSM